MHVYIARRLLALIPTLFFASLVVFVTVRLIPGSVIDLMLSQNDIAVGKNRALLVVTGQTWNPSQYTDPAFDRKMAEIYLTRDETKRQQMIREMTVEILDKAPYVWLPTPYVYSAWWPWVQNYNGELRAGAVRPGPIYARLWIDQEMKKKMGF